MQIRKVICDIPGCKSSVEEEEWGSGFPGWMQLKGVALNAVSDPMLCPMHVSMVMDYVDTLGAEKHGVD